MKTIKQLEKEIEELENKSWFRCDVKDAKKQWLKLTTQLQALQNVLDLIDELTMRDHRKDPTVINYIYLKDKIEGIK